MGRGAVLRQKIGAEAGAPAQRIVDDQVLQEGAAALLDPDQAACRQFGDRAAHGVAVDRETGGKLGLGRQARARLEPAGPKVALEPVRDLAPDRDAAAALQGIGRALSSKDHRAAVGMPLHAER